MQVKFPAKILVDAQLKEKLNPYIKHLANVKKETRYNFSESFINAPFDTESLREMIKLAKKIESNLKPDLIFVFGLGGSSLASKALKTPLGSRNKIIYFDTFDLDLVKKYLIDKKITQNKKILAILVSKNGKTTESDYYAEILSKGIKLAVITAKDSPLYEKVKSNSDIDLLLFSPKISGRFSAFTSANLFPLLFEGLNILKICKGAQKAVENIIKSEGGIPLILAINEYNNLQNKKTIFDTFVFKQSLENLGKWARQLYGESLGKNNVELFPTVSVGTADLHSMYQRYLGGKSNIFTNFLYLNEKDLAIKTFEKLKYSNIQEIAQKSPKQIIEAIYKGVVRTYKNKNMSFVEFIFEKDSLEEDLGEFMMTKMIEVIFLAQLLNVNAFDQPEVEFYKTETIKLLKKQKEKNGNIEF